MRGARRRSHSRGTTTAIVAALFTLLAIAAFAAPQAEAAKAKKIRKCNGQKILCDRPFDQVVLPAAHNAMSSASLDWVFANQSIAMPDQLTYGIRGFLIDTHYGRLKAEGRSSRTTTAASRRASARAAPTSATSSASSARPRWPKG